MVLRLLGLLSEGAPTATRAIESRFAAVKKNTKQWNRMRHDVATKGGYDTVKIEVTQTPRPTRPTTAIPVRAEE
eukprot:6190981-Prymnesium_polylepis.1